MRFQTRIQAARHARGQSCDIGIGYIRNTAPSQFQVSRFKADMVRRYRHQRGWYTGHSFLWPRELE